EEDGDAALQDLQTRLSSASIASVELSDGSKIDYAGASVGMVCLMPDSTDVDDALQKADAAMYKVKASRKPPEALAT
ncbi:MAG: diguanylate cyclase, partial [Comamonas sp.]